MIYLLIKYILIILEKYILKKKLYDITLIEIKESDGINSNCFLEIDNEDEAFDNETDVKKDIQK